MWLCVTPRIYWGQVKMRTIYLVRHAKAEPIADTDKQRALSDIGISDAQKLEFYFQKNFKLLIAFFAQTRIERVKHWT